MARELRKIIPKEIALTYQGDWIGSFDEYGTVLQILVQPENLETTYNFGIKDEDGYVIYQNYGIQGALSDVVELPLFPGEKHLIINGASSDEIFKVKLIYQL